MTNCPGQNFCEESAPRLTVPHLYNIVFREEYVLRLEVAVYDWSPYATLAHTGVAELKGHHHLAQQVPQERLLKVLPVRSEDFHVDIVRLSSGRERGTDRTELRQRSDKRNAHVLPPKDENSRGLVQVSVYSPSYALGADNPSEIRAAVLHDDMEPRTAPIHDAIVVAHDERVP